MLMKKFVLKLDLQDDREKRKALKLVSALSGIDEIFIDLKGKKLTVIGTVDPVSVASRLRKYWQTDIISVGPAKEPEKKEEAKKEEPKKEEPKKEEPKKEEGKKEEPKKEEEKKPGPPAPVPVPVPVHRPYYPQMPMHMPIHQMQMPVVGSTMQYRPYYPPPPMQTYYHVNHSMEENPNACVIS